MSCLVDAKVVKRIGVIGRIRHYKNTVRINIQALVEIPGTICSTPDSTHE